MTLHTCNYCIFSTQQKSAYDAHKNTMKHKNNVIKSNRNNKVDVSGNLIEKIVQQNEEYGKQNSLSDTSKYTVRSMIKDLSKWKKLLLALNIK